MRQLQQMIRILAVVSAVWLTALINQQSADVVRFVDFKNNAVFEPRFYEGKDAETVAQIL